MRLLSGRLHSAAASIAPLASPVHDRLLFLGSDAFSVTLLDAIITSRVARDVTVVSTPSPHQVRRGHDNKSELMRWTEARGIECHVVPRGEEEWAAWTVRFDGCLGLEREGRS